MPGAPTRSGERLVQPQLAATLAAIAAGGAEAFYRGPTGAAIAAASRAGGGILTEADLAAYRVRDLAPVRCSYRGYEVISRPRRRAPAASPSARSCRSSKATTSPRWATIRPPRSMS